MTWPVPRKLTTERKCGGIQTRRTLTVPIKNSVKDCFKILRSLNCPLKSIYEYDLKNMLSSWIIFVKNTLLSNGIGDVWNYPESVNEQMFYL